MITRATSIDNVTTTVTSASDLIANGRDHTTISLDLLNAILSLKAIVNDVAGESKKQNKTLQLLNDQIFKVEKRVNTQDNDFSNHIENIIQTQNDLSNRVDHIVSTVTNKVSDLESIQDDLISRVRRLECAQDDDITFKVSNHKSTENDLVNNEIENIGRIQTDISNKIFDLVSAQNSISSDVRNLRRAQTYIRNKFVKFDSTQIDHRNRVENLLRKFVLDHKLIIDDHIHQQNKLLMWIASLLVIYNAVMIVLWTSSLLFF